MIRAYLIYTGADGNTHVTRGSMGTDLLVEAQSILFKESPPGSTLDWHRAPVQQYVLTLSGILEFTTMTGASFILHPGEVLIATDVTGTGHKWRLVNDAPWKRAYIVFKEGADVRFLPDLGESLP